MLYFFVVEFSLFKVLFKKKKKKGVGVDFLKILVFFIRYVCQQSFFFFLLQTLRKKGESCSRHSVIFGDTLDFYCLSEAAS